MCPSDFLSDSYLLIYYWYICKHIYVYINTTCWVHLVLIIYTHTYICIHTYIYIYILYMHVCIMYFSDHLGLNKLSSLEKIDSPLDQSLITCSSLSMDRALLDFSLSIKRCFIHLPQAVFQKVFQNSSLILKRWIHSLRIDHRHWHY